MAMRCMSGHPGFHGARVYLQVFERVGVAIEYVTSFACFARFDLEIVPGIDGGSDMLLVGVCAESQEQYGRKENALFVHHADIEPF